MKPLTGIVRAAFLGFFASHIPITLIVDGQAVFPPSLVPQFAKDVLRWYSTTFNDRLMTPPYDNIFFTSFIWCELLFQLPFFVIATNVLCGKKVDGTGWFRSLCLIYGAHTCTTLIPILVSIANQSENTTKEKIILVAFYLPYLIFPFWLTLICLFNKDILLDRQKCETQYIHAKVH